MGFNTPRCLVSLVLGRNKTNVAPLQCLNWMDEIGYSRGRHLQNSADFGALFVEKTWPYMNSSGMLQSILGVVRSRIT